MATRQQAGSTHEADQTLPAEIRRLLLVVEASLDEEGFGFVSEELEAVVASPVSQRQRLTNLRAVVWSLRTATPMLANSTCLALDAVDGALDDALAQTFDS